MKKGAEATLGMGEILQGTGGERRTLDEFN
jgi:hypothetical protein